MSLDEAEAIVPSGTSWEDVVDRGRQTLWRRTLDRVPGSDILLLEFGVWKGDSTRQFVKLNSSPRSLFYGFDSFEGLPEDWRGMAAERFDLGGALPRIDDERVTFVKGWFRDSLPPLLDRLAEEGADRAVVVHFDADLFSSTLYLLFTLGTRFKRYHFIFDEFSGHETRALYNYIQATGAEVKFFYRLDWQGFAQVVSGELTLP
jgi:O-methyltransferase